MPTRIPLNRCDYHFLTLQRSAKDATVCRFKATMGFDVAGEIASDDLRARMLDALGGMPVLAGRLRYSKVFARPAWEVGEPASIIEDAYRFEDLTSASDPIAAAEASVERAASGAIDLSRPPILRLHHLRTREFDRVVLAWPHPLMDGQGGYEVLRRIGGAKDAAGGQSIESAPTRRLPFEKPPGLRSVRAFRGFLAQRAVSRIQTKLPPLGKIDPAEQVRFARRLNDSGSFETIATMAKRLTPGGPGLYARYLAACTIRALRRLYDNHGWHTPNYAISFPMRPGGMSAVNQPLGNYLVAAALQVPHDVALDWPRLGEAIARQVTAFSTTGADKDQWELLGAAGMMRPGQYHAMMKSSVAMTPLISGYSYFQAEDDQPVEQFAGRPIVRTLFGGMATVPPAWNPVFWRHGPRITMTLAWPVGFIDDALAIEFADLIEQEALGLS